MHITVVSICVFLIQHIFIFSKFYMQKRLETGVWNIARGLQHSLHIQIYVSKYANTCLCYLKRKHHKAVKIR